MIVVSVFLKSAVDGRVQELARSVIHNAGGTTTRGDYECFSCVGRDRDTLNANMIRLLKKELKPRHKGEVKNYPRQELHVWNLVARALLSMGYGLTSTEK